MLRAHIFRKNQPIEVKVLSPRGREPQWIPGTIIKPVGRGAFVKTAQFENFVTWSDIREAPESTERVSAPLAKLGEKLRLVPSTSSSVLITNEQLAEMRKETEGTKRGAAEPRKPHADRALTVQRPILNPDKQTQIGSLVRELRLKTDRSQAALGKALGLDQTGISRIELGRELPKDDVLIKLTECFSDLDLTALIEMREHDAAGRKTRPSLSPAKPPAAKEEEPEATKMAIEPLSRVEARMVALRAKRGAPELGPATELLDEPKPAPKPEPEPEPIAAIEPLEPFEDFIERLCDIAPIPADREKRREWFRLAKQLRAL